jgi:repressor LexA
MATYAELIDQGVARRESILQYLRTYIESNGYPPSMAEIAEEEGIAKSAIRHHLYRLQRDGIITMTPSKYRSIRVLS